MQQLNQSENSLYLEGVCHKLCLNDVLGNDPVAFDDAMNQEDLDSLGLGPN
jgi:hypothetical protein